MVTRVGFTACCTASIVYNFGYGDNLPDGCERLLDQAINSSRSSRQSLVVATTTLEQRAGSALLEKKGFKKVMDVADIKYPGTSKRLQLWALDLNEKATEALNIAAPVNPFAPAAAAPVAPPEAPPVAQQLQRAAETMARVAAAARQTVPAPARARGPVRSQSGRFIGVGQTFRHDFNRDIPQSWLGRGDLRFDILVPAHGAHAERVNARRSVDMMRTYRATRNVNGGIRTVVRTA